MNKQAQISLSHFQVCPFGLDESNGNDELEYFDNCHELVRNNRHKALALALTFTNELYCADYMESEAVSAPVSVTIRNIAQRQTVSSGKFTVNIPPSAETKEYLIDLPFPQDEFSPFDRFRVTVRDVKSKVVLGNYDISFATTAEDEFEKRINDFIASELESLGGDEKDLEEHEVTPEEPEEAVEEIPTEPEENLLDKMVGLESVKSKLAVYRNVVKFNQMRCEKGLPVFTTPLHAMFLGSPGTGKTTVAKYMGKMLADAGVLSSGHVVVKERATLCGQNYNSESEKTLEAINEAQGGILLIDEAYQLFQPHDPRDPGKFVIETLLTALADESKRDWMLILSGYSEPMLQMFDMNPGLRSRIPDTNIYRFEDFTEAQLMEIADSYLLQGQYQLTDDARSALQNRLHGDFVCRDKTFGNARHVVNLLQTEVLQNMAARVATQLQNPTDEELSLIQAEDVPDSTQQVPKPKRIGFKVA